MRRRRPGRRPIGAVDAVKVAAIIPAYNEERTVADVVRATLASGVADEVIVVDDGSEDATAEVARRAGARVVSLPHNRGKGAAMKAGAIESDAEVLIFLDADLTGLCRDHLVCLLDPVVNEGYDMSVGVFDEGRFTTDMAQKIAPFLSGQRAMRRSIIVDLPQVERTGYGVEVALSRYAEQQGLKVKRVVLKRLAQVTKEEKRGFIKGFRARLKMYWEIIRFSRLS